MEEKRVEHVSIREFEEKLIIKMLTFHCTSRKGQEASPYTRKNDNGLEKTIF